MLGVSAEVAVMGNAGSLETQHHAHFCLRSSHIHRVTAASMLAIVYSYRQHVTHHSFLETVIWEQPLFVYHVVQSEVMTSISSQMHLSLAGAAVQV